MDTAPTVYFIDDSATMREVIKIAFRRENINVIACHDAASAFAQIEQQAPDVVITDVIMPDKDGYEVCQHIKHHPTLSKTPVILMSGVVNKAVADKAFAVKADELIRKPFQPQDLITRVRHLLNPATAAPPVAPMAAAASAAALSSIFAAPAGAANLRTRPAMPPVSVPPPHTQPAAPPQQYASPAPPAPAARVIPPMPQRPVPAGMTAPASLDLQKMKLELMRLENLVKKLQSELEAEREYTRALEEHVKTLTESER
jgi:CheY-like chemotaxis protein